MISYGKHKIDSKDIREVSKVLKSDFLTSGTTKFGSISVMKPRPSHC